MGDVVAGAHKSVIFELFWQKFEFPWHFLPSQVFALLRNRLRLNDVTLSLYTTLGLFLSVWERTAHLVNRMFSLRYIYL